MLSHFFYLGPSSNVIMQGHYNYVLVALSFCIAILAAYVALDIAGRLQETTNLKTKTYWLIGGAFSMGAGIWTMHFVGMLALSVPIKLTYDIFWTAVSMAVAIIASLFALTLVHRRDIPRSRVFLGGIFFGLAIVSMHYIGMYALKNSVHLHYKPGLFTLSILIALFASEAALFAALKSNEGMQKKHLLLKFSSAIIMGLAIVGMHYTAVAAAVFVPVSKSIHTGNLNTKGLVFYIALTSILILVIAIMASTYKRKITLAVKNQENFLDAVLQHINDGIIAFNKENKQIVINRAFKEMVGAEENILAPEKLMDLYKLYHPHTNTLVPNHERPVMRLIKGQLTESEEFILINNLGEKRIVLMDCQPILGVDHKPLGGVVVIHDITSRKAMENQLQKQAIHDTLTGLLNRSVIQETIEGAIKGCLENMVALLFIDLDGLKKINDTFGHRVGDEILKNMGQRLRGHLKECNYGFRIGGDEFVILLTDKSNLNELYDFAEKILKEISAPMFVNDIEFKITASIGLSYYPEYGKNAENLLKYADMAMYKAKAKGKNCICEI